MEIDDKTPENIEKEDKISETPKKEDKISETPKHIEDEDIISLRFNPWKLSVAILGIVLIISLVFNFTGLPGGGATGLTVASPTDVQNKIESYVKSIAQGQTVSITNIVEENELYKVTIDVGGSPFDSYATKDGKLLFPQALELDKIPSTPDQGTQQTVSKKTDKPEVHAFIMSYCPYGLQFIKAYVPVIELLGEKADVELNFVHYIMHGEKEIQENNRMYCIQKEQNDKLTAYLRCFVASDDYEKCIEETGVDKEKLEACISATDEEFKITELYEDESTWSNGRFPQYPVDKDISEEYGVRGSPTFVINSEQISVQRSSESIKQAICSAFTTKPEECSQTLNSAPEAAGMGPIGEGGGDSGAQC